MANKPMSDVSTPSTDRNNNKLKKSTGKKRKAGGLAATNVAKTRKRVAEEAAAALDQLVAEDELLKRQEDKMSGADAPITVAMLKEALRESNEDLEERLEKNIKKQIDAAVGPVSAAVRTNTNNIDRLTAEIRELKRSVSDETTRAKIESVLEERRIESPQNQLQRSERRCGLEEKKSSHTLGPEGP